MRPLSLFVGVDIALMCSIAITILAMRGHEVGRLTALQQRIAHAHGLVIESDPHSWGESSQRGCGGSRTQLSPRVELDRVDKQIQAAWNATRTTELLDLQTARRDRTYLIETFPIDLAGTPERDAGPEGSDLQHLTSMVLRREILNIPPGDALAWDSPLRQHRNWTSPANVLSDVRDWWTLPAELTDYLEWLSRIADRVDAGEQLTDRELTTPPTGLRLLQHPQTPPSTIALLSAGY